MKWYSREDFEQMKARATERKMECKMVGWDPYHGPQYMKMKIMKVDGKTYMVSQESPDWVLLVEV